MAVNLYGIEKFCDDIESMIGRRPNLYWRTCWKFISPSFLVIVVVSAVISSEKLTFHNYLYPDWATTMGWLFSLSSVSAIPLMFLVHVIKQRYCKSGSGLQQPDSQPDPTFV